VASLTRLVPVLHAVRSSKLILPYANSKSLYLSRLEPGKYDVSDWRNDNLGYLAVSSSRYSFLLSFCKRLLRGEAMFKHCSPLGKMAEITDFLYLGGLAAARMEDILTKKGITCVINASIEAPDVNYESIKTTRIKLEDNATCNIGVHFDIVADKIDKVRRERGKVLVHCVAGISRSATLVLAYLMKYHKMKLIDAHTYVKEKRPLIRPNPGFWKDLVDFEKKLFRKNTVDMVESKFGLVPSIYKDEVKNLVW